jgi:hypothetical protein
MTCCWNGRSSAAGYHLRQMIQQSPLEYALSRVFNGIIEKRIGKTQAFMSWLFLKG